MITIALISSVGGAGRTSLATALAHHLSQLGRPVRLVQLDPKNNLPFQLGLNTAADRGVFQAAQQQLSMLDIQLPLNAPFQAVPFGSAVLSQLCGFEHQLVDNPQTLTTTLFRDAQAGLIQLLDLPAWPSALANAALSFTDLNLVLLTPDTHAVLGIDPLLPQLLRSRGASYFLMNRFDSTKVLHLDLWTLCKTKLGHRLLPFYLHEDQGLPESTAAGVSLGEYAPKSQLLEDHQKLANWIDAELS
ncbi:cellulose biosynthesis protein BcsQ [Limnobacter humi]|uniref:Cellulose biosynthesis protein BcsQ n=1 Tax=Limnobacter humi TaxID=1778671 RepID=A0ABT1WD23_9BURK|nr:cellulose biosynthesis protein BcsQ [Limnobacter humi]MCQ8895420.1 cellulose biosynthesis protein BcsQ [Limnobacter humi]